MNFKENIKELRKAIERNNLVVFIGAGISKNSDIPTWSELIKCFAEKLEYDNCKNCNCRKPDCPIPCCKYRYNFSQDEYLKIPQYFFNEDSFNYYEVIKKVLDVEAKPNIINEFIIDLYPKHIITTNFDRLIENTKRPNSMMYKVIVKDEDLLTPQISNNYIIKMHGDINDSESIVLKESDYLDYQKKHILIETFIKSLLIDHTFLFIGYSLNDYNLKLIINWIESLAKEYNARENRSKNYIIQPDINNIEKYIESYFLGNNLILIKTSELPKGIKEKYLNVALKDEGKDVYTILNYIFDSKNDYLVEPLIDVLYDRYQIFKNQKRIAFEDLILVHSFGSAEHIGTVLLFYEKSKFESLKEILIANDEKANFINEILNKTGIEGIQYNQNNSFQPISGNDKGQNIYYKLIELEQSNKYTEILSMIDNTNDEMLKAYYLFITDPFSESLLSCLEIIKKSLENSEDYFRLILFNYNMNCINQIRWKDTKKETQDFKAIFKNISQPYKTAYRYFEKLYEGNRDNVDMSNQLADKCEEMYTKRTNTIYMENIQNHDLLKLQAIVYDYYYYFKINNLMLDHFTNPKVFFGPYVRAMLCTYTPKKERELKDLFGFEQTPLKVYKINSTDFDIIIKHTDLKKLKLFISDFNVKELIFEEDIKVEEKFIDLCNTVISFPNRFLLAYLNNFLYILTKYQLDNPRLNIIFNKIFELLFEKSETKKILSNIFKELQNFVRFYRDENIVIFTKMLNRFLDIDIIEYLKKDHAISLGYLYRLLNKYSNEETKEKVSLIIDNIGEISEKIKMIYNLRSLFNEHQKIVYTTIVKNNLKLVSLHCLFEYIEEKYLYYDEKIEECFYIALQKEIGKRKEKPGVKSYPDILVDTLELIIILFLIGKIKSLKKFDCFTEYSEQLDFLLNPKDFDYSKVRTENYMWMNFMQNKKYRKIFKEHRSKIIINLKKSVDNGYATESQKIMLYRYFLTEREISDYL